MRQLADFWHEQDCAISPTSDIENGDGIFSPHVFFRALKEDSWCGAYIERVRRPADGRRGKHPIRLFRHHEFYVWWKPALKNIRDLFMQSLVAVGLDCKKHDIRFISQDWTASSLSANSVGWEVDIDGMRVIRYSYMQTLGGIDISTPPVVLAYDIERLALIIQDKDSVFDLQWDKQTTYDEMFRCEEEEYSSLYIDDADVTWQRTLFDGYLAEGEKLLASNHLLPAYEYALKCVYSMNILASRGTLSDSDRANCTASVRALVRAIATQSVETSTELNA